ncbi:MmcQ/YjbR family DNA-binding protein [Deinococcus sp. QL22]|uniref:MmcQ/YjbR family DNA-binding protein n=1 Tax=Deinococcus sp. QL22 TaxID=2939437 RepID=UPI002017F12C|nr:MmcQ/YjbR family DNA-binding protein [Deinococcus sp. QL22]UQN07588.1 MmcQ/YjbR family DNA-binding protein [Deinococcus sp. QL22]
MRSVSDLRAACAALPHSSETFPFGMDTLVWKVGRPDAAKMYALSGINADPLTLSLKVRPEYGDTLRAVHAAIVPGYHLNKRHWVTVTLDGRVPGELVQELLAGSHALVLSSFTRAQRADLEL